MAHESPSRICVCVEAKLLRVEKEDVQTLVRTDERANESATVVCDDAKSAAKEALECLNCLCVLHLKQKDKLNATR